MKTQYRKLLLIITLLMLTPLGKINGEICVNDTIDYEKGCYGMENCCDFSTTTCPRYYIAGELLYWRAYAGDLCKRCGPSQITDIIPQTGITESVMTTEIGTLDYEWNPGYRLLTGCEFGSGTIVEIDWTHYTTHARRHHANNDRVNWHLNFETLDFILGQEVCYSECLHLKPYVGLHNVWIKQNLHFNFTDSLTTNGVTTLTSVDAGNAQRYFAIGPKIGLGADWGLGGGFNLFGDAAIACVYGHTHVTSFENDLSATLSSSTTLARKSDDIQAVIDARIGFSWTTCLCDNIYLSLKTAFENHLYFDQNKMTSNENLSVGGLTFSAELNF